MTHAWAEYRLVDARTSRAVSPFLVRSFVVAGALSALVLACHEAQCPAPPPAPRADASPPPAPCLTAAAPPPGDAGAEAGDARAAAAPKEAVEPPAAFAAFLREKATLRYRLVDTVNPHSVRGGKEETTDRATYVVSELTAENGAYRAAIEWTFSSGDAVPSVLPDVLVASAGELRVGEDPGPFVYRAAELTSKDTRPTCREERDTGPYGKTLRRLCFDAKGLASLREENLHGPRVFELVRE